MLDLKPFLLSRHEAVLFKCLDKTGKRPRDVMRETQIPHASLYLAFAKLSERGLAQRIIRKGLIYWRVQHLVGNQLSKTGDTIGLFTTKDAIRECINQLLALKEGSRVIIVEGTQSDSGWFNIFSTEETINLNRALSRKKIICENILPESYLQDAIPYLGLDWALSFKARPIITYLIKKDLIISNALLVIFQKKVILLDAKELVAVEICNKEIIHLIQGMVEVIKGMAKKVLVDDELVFK